MGALELRAHLILQFATTQGSSSLKYQEGTVHVLISLYLFNCIALVSLLLYINSLISLNQLPFGNQSESRSMSVLLMIFTYFCKNSFQIEASLDYQPLGLPKKYFLNTSRALYWRGYGIYNYFGQSTYRLIFIQNSLCDHCGIILL